MDTKKYEVFSKIVELSSLTKAAEALGLTQSGVSHILLGLEEEMGFPLLRRSRVGARLTPEGERLMPFIQDILRSQEQLEQTAADLRGLAAGTLRVATFTSVAVHWLPGMMQEFQTMYPKVDFRLLNGDYHDVDRWLTDGSADVGFIALPTPLRCEYIPLKEDRLLAVLPPGHPLAEREICPVAEVAKEPFISLLETSDDDARRALDAAGVRPNVRFTTKDDYAIIAMVEQGLGVSIMPELLLQGHREGVAVRPLDPPASRMLALAVPAGDRAGPVTRRFAEFVREWVQKKIAP
ncbi:MAG: LysR family transcriptional regulator [Oscillospiraceae bacterium]|nr:LysR family transcriptional regulator [Oscillospiraceae bacterium]